MQSCEVCDSDSAFEPDGSASEESVDVELWEDIVPMPPASLDTVAEYSVDDIYKIGEAVTLFEEDLETDRGLSPVWA